MALHELGGKCVFASEWAFCRQGAWSQIVTLNGKHGEHLKYMPYVFTENGVAMLSGILRSPTAIETNIRIIRAFVAMRHFDPVNEIL